VEDLAQRIDQLLIVLKDISEDLAEISKQLKSAGVPALAPAPAMPAAPIPQAPAARTRSIAEVRTIFPKELEDLLFFEESGEYIIVKPRRFLGSENFAKIASLVRSAGGEYIRAGKESHFRVLREIR